MQLRQHLMDIYNEIKQSDRLLRLLHYPTDPLAISKPNIVGSTQHASIADEHIFWTPKTTDLTLKPTCRLCVFSGQRTPYRNNFLVADQDFVFDIYVHIEAFDQKDLRLSWITDTINDLISEERITGMGKIAFLASNNIADAPEGYVGYRMIYSFGSGQR